MLIEIQWRLHVNICQNKLETKIHIHLIYDNMIMFSKIDVMHTAVEVLMSVNVSKQL